MNAHQLIDLLHTEDVQFSQQSLNAWAEEAATMLRQQEADKQILNDTITICEDHIERLQAEIEALKKEAALQRLSDFTQEAENEPVALVTEYGIHPLHEGALQEDQFLYTHPHPDNFELAESIIKQQQLEINRLKVEIEELKVLLDKTLNNWAKDLERNRK